MRYFTSELWSMFNSSINEEQIRADLMWKNNVKAYVERFDKLSNRISKKVYNILKHVNFHDYEIKLIKIDQPKENRDIQVVILISNSKDTWEIKYRCIKRISINYDSIPKYLLGLGFDSWGYHELLDVDENTLSHEILFASGASIIIYFKNKNLFINKL